MFFTSKKQVIFIILKHLGLACAIAVFALIVVKFTSKQIVTIGNSAAQRKKISLLLERRGETLAKLKDQLKTSSADGQVIISAFPPADNVLPFLDTLEKIAAENSVIQVVKFSEPVPEPASPAGFPVSKIDFSITLNGNVINIQNYLSQFEKLAFFTTITAITLQAPPVVGWNSQAAASINARVYTH